MCDSEITFCAERLNQKWHFGRYFGQQIVMEVRKASEEYHWAERIKITLLEKENDHGQINGA